MQRDQVEANTVSALGSNFFSRKIHRGQGVEVPSYLP